MEKKTRSKDGELENSNRLQMDKRVQQLLRQSIMKTQLLFSSTHNVKSCC